MSFRLMELEGDSREYEVLFDAAANIASLPGATCEIGLRLGGGTEAIVRGMIHGSPEARKPHIAIDPYGNIEYAEGTQLVRNDYTNELRDTAIPQIYAFCAKNKVNFMFFNLEDTEFFKRYADGVPIYAQNKTMITQYALVHFDGPHSVEALIREVIFFAPRAPRLARFIFDDYTMYDHGVIDKLVTNYGFTCYYVGKRKMAYIKDRYPV